MRSIAQNSSEKPLRALLWLAVSTPEQAKDEKESLHAQEMDARAACEAHGWQIVDVLRIPGFSRRFLDIKDFARGAAAEGYEDGWRLIRHLEAGDFDVFVTRDGDRFGRSQSLFSRIAEDILFEQKKLIYATHGGGLVSEQGGREWITMQSYRAAKHVDDLVQKRDMGMEKNAQRGLPTTSQIPLSHKLIRNSHTGRAEKLIVNEDVRWLWDSLAELILEGVAWRDIEVALFERYGYGNSKGQPFSRRKFHKLVMAPVFWGNSARKFRGVGYTKPKGDIPGKPGEWKDGLWAVEPGHEIPEGVSIYYNTHDAVWTGDLAVKVKAELRRRDLAVVGKAKARTKYWPTGLFICGVCGSKLNVHPSGSKSGTYYMRCVQRYNAMPGQEKCTNSTFVAERDLRDRLTDFLRAAAEWGDFEKFLSFLMGEDTGREHTLRVQIVTLEREAARISELVGQLILNEASAGEAVRVIYAQQIADKDAELSAIQRRLEELRREDTSRENEARRLAYEDVRATIDRFWERPDVEINQTLTALFGSHKPVITDGKCSFRLPLQLDGERRLRYRGKGRLEKIETSAGPVLVIYDEGDNEDTVS